LKAVVYTVMTMQAVQLTSFSTNLISRSENTTDCTEQRHREAESHPFSQENSCISWNPKVLHQIQNLPLYHILNHTQAFHIFIIPPIRSRLILSYNLCPFLTSRLSTYLYHAFNFCRYFLIKPDPQSLLSMSVNNTTHAQPFHASQ